MSKDKIFKTNYVFLDYDGFICKAWYAYVSRASESDSPMMLLEMLETEAIRKAQHSLEGNIRVIKFISGHSWKKDLYDTYKANRKKDPFIGAMRAQIKAQDADVIKLDSLEADEAIAMLSTYLQERLDDDKHCIIFSDDKDLHRISEYYCKVNFEECITKNESTELYYEQFLAGDKEDNVTGIPKVGYASARKLLDKNGYNLEGVIKSYKEKGMTQQDCVKNLVLIDPMTQEHNTEKEYMNNVCYHFLNDCNECILNECSKTIQDGLVEYMNQEVSKIYVK